MALGQGAKLSADAGEGERDRPQERAHWFLRGRMVNGKPGSEQLHRAYDQKLNNRRLQGQSRLQTGETQTTGTAVASPRPLFVTAPSGSAPWNFLGPAPTATAAFNSAQQDYGPAVGRVTSVVVDQSDTTGNTVYLGGASGGVWRTTNAVSATRSCNGNGVCTAPATWSPLIDGQATLTVGAIALQPGNSNLILVGTGEANNSADSYYGLGILRSIDRGSNWTLISSATCPTSNPACPSSGTMSFHGLGFTRIAFSTDSPNVVVAAAAGAAGGIAVGAETGGSSARGLYASTDSGLTWQRASVQDTGAACTNSGRTSPCAPDAGSANSVLYNPSSGEKKFFANLRYHGIYSSADGVNWTRLACQPGDTVSAGVCTPNTGILSATACPSATSSGCPLYRAEMALVPGRDEMYIWIYNAQESDIGMWQTLDGGQTWKQVSTTGIDSCGDAQGCGNDSSGQGTYNISLAAVPNGGATDLYAGGVNEYKCTVNAATNPTCATSPFINLTHVYGCNPAGNAAHVHPDEHGIDFLGNDVTGAFVASHPGFDPPVFFGNDGGIYRVSKGSSLTGTGACPSGTPPSQFDNLSPSAGFSMIQFVGFSQHATDPTTLLGGTQDNGSPAVSSASPSSGNWLSVNNGDGGFNAINPQNGSEWFTSNPAPLTSSGGIQRCTNGIQCTFNPAAIPPGFKSVVTQNQICGDYSSFYTFFMLDPQASGRMLVGSCRVWRGNSDGSQSSSLGGTWSLSSTDMACAASPPLSLTLNLDTLANASCGNPTSNPTTFMVNTIAAGGPCNGPCDPGITPASGTGGGSQVIWAGMEGIADATSAALQCPPGGGSGKPCGGQVWRTLAADTGTGSWCEVSGLGAPGYTPPAGCPSVTSTACTATASACNINPNHYSISGIALDPNDTTGKTAYVTVMGFGVGHIFKTIDAGATWAKLDGDPTTTGLPDAPADAVVTPPASAITAYPSLANVVYVGTDVGVFWSTGNGVWTEVGPSSGAGSLPNVTVTQLKIYNNPTDPNGLPLRLRASTYGRGIWEVSIAPVPGFAMAISNPELFAFAGQAANYNGNIVTFNGYTNSINITCTAGGTAPPSTCPSSGNPVIVPAPATSGSFNVVAGNSTFGDFTFNLTAVGTDAKAVTQQAAVTLHSVDFTLGAVPASTVGAGDTADVSFTASAQGQFSGSVSLSCSGQPTGTACTFSPSVVSLTPGLTANVRLTIPTSSSTLTGTYTVTITGTSTLGSASQSHTTALALTMTVTSASASFSAKPVGALTPNPAKPGQSLSASVNLTAGSTYTGTLSLSCVFDSTAGNPGASTCAMSPPSVTLSAGQTLFSTLMVNTSGALATNPRVIVTAKDVPNNSSQNVNFDYSVVDYSLTLGTAAAAVPGGSTTINVSVAAQNGYTGKVAAVCSPPPPSPLTCTLAAGLLDLTTSTTTSTTATVAAPANTPAGAYTINVNTNDQVFPSLVHYQSVNVSVQDWQIAASPNTETVKAGGTPTPHTVTITGQGGFTGNIALSCTSANFPPLTTCTFTPASVPAGGTSTLIIQTTAPSVSLRRPPNARRAAPLYALWITMPGVVFGLIAVASAPKRARGRLIAWLSLALSIGLLLAMAACGGGGGGSTTTPPIPKPGTPPGLYNINVTGASGSGATALTRSSTITLTVN